MNIRTVILFFALFIFFLSCTRDKGKIEPLANLNIPDSCSTNISFSKQIIPIINASCVIPTCHTLGVKDVVDFNIPSNIILSATTGDMKNRINGTGANDPMPKDVPGGLPSCEKAKIISWINAGAPNN